MTDMIILHGLGQTPEDWQEIATKVCTDVTVISLFQNINTSSDVTLASIYANVQAQLNSRTDDFYLYGLSLGGLLTLMYATEQRNPLLKGFIVSGAIYKSIPKFLNDLQTTIFRIMPETKFSQFGLNKRQVISLMSSIRLDLTNELRTLAIPTLIICGDNDKVNLKSAKQIASLIPDSNLEIIENGKHELNVSNPK